mmetsp:Transcript_7141/g.20639  ORF Transcript_7141/g.20639 Transcript_7141/m.20639 type:complete len:253 (-) Transcript_7141:79-837(-)
MCHERLVGLQQGAVDQAHRGVAHVPGVGEEAALRVQVDEGHVSRYKHAVLGRCLGLVGGVGQGHIGVQRQTDEHAEEAELLPRQHSQCLAEIGSRGVLELEFQVPLEDPRADPLHPQVTSVTIRPHAHLLVAFPLPTSTGLLPLLALPAAALVVVVVLGLLRIACGATANVLILHQSPFAVLECELPLLPPALTGLELPQLTTHLVTPLLLLITLLTRGRVVYGSANGRLEGIHGVVSPLHVAEAWTTPPGL